MFLEVLQEPQILVLGKVVFRNPADKLCLHMEVDETRETRVSLVLQSLHLSVQMLS